MYLSLISLILKNLLLNKVVKRVSANIVVLDVLCSSLIVAFGILALMVFLKSKILIIIITVYCLKIFQSA